MYRLVIFDWDGTLGDTREGAFHVVNRVMTKRGYPEINMARFEMISHSGAEYLICSAAGVPTGTDLSAQLYDEYVQEYLATPECQLFPGGRETLQALTEGGVIVAMLSNKMPSVVHAQMRFNHCETYFSHVLCADGSTALKPEPDGVLRLMELAGVAPEETLVVGDSSADILAAQRAGAAACYAAYGIGALPAELHPEHTITHLSQIIPLALDA